jgi:light-regulated signal transduction histidine kinase (bacteriophytochrome)
MTSPWLLGALFFCGLAAVMWRQLERERQTQRSLSAELAALRQRATELAATNSATDLALTSASTLASLKGPLSDANRLPSQTEQDEQASFSYTVSHDLRAPIRVVEGFTKIVKEDYGRVMDRIGNDHLDRVLAAAARMNSMIDALLALSRLSTQPLAQQPVNLSQLANFVVDDLRRQSPERAVTLQIEPGLLAHGDPTLLRMVLENLIGNAWKYTGKSAQPMVVFERGEPAPHSASGAVHTFTVRDNGAGFDMRFSDRLFGVFQRLHSVNDFPGTGVGLASVRRIVRRHGGEIWADAEVDKGAAFHFSLRA